MEKYESIKTKFISSENGNIVESGFKTLGGF